MTEWEVVGVFVVLIGLFFTVSTPIMKLITSITKLTTTVENLQNNVENITRKNTESHRRLWEHNEQQDKEIKDHGSRIEKLEGKVEGYHGK